MDKHRILYDIGEGTERFIGKRCGTCVCDMEQTQAGVLVMVPGKDNQNLTFLVEGTTLDIWLDDCPTRLIRGKGNGK